MREHSSQPFDTGKESERESAEILTERIQNLAERLLRVQGSTMASTGEPGFSGDAASLYVLAGMPNQLGAKPQLVKVGWGEFSHNTFTTGAIASGVSGIGGREMQKKYDTLRALPFEVYCVAQRDSYFAEGKVVERMLNQPAEYLRQHARLAARAGTVTPAEKSETGKVLNYEIIAKPAEQLIAQMRNCLVQTFSSP